MELVVVEGIQEAHWEVVEAEAETAEAEAETVEANWEVEKVGPPAAEWEMAETGDCSTTLARM